MYVYICIYVCEYYKCRYVCILYVHVYIYAFPSGILVILPEAILCFSRNFNTLYKKEFCHTTIIFLYKLFISIKSITNLHY